MLSTLPRLIGHRGAKEDAPENTLASLRLAARQGAAWVEIDAMLSRDGVPMVIHDDTLERTTSGRGAVADLDLAALKRLDAGGWFAPRFAGEPVPTLAEALALAATLGLGLNVEIKPSPGRAVETARETLATLRRDWAADRPLLVSSFETACLEVARDLAPEMARGYLLERAVDGWAATADRLDVATLNLDHAALDEPTVAALGARGRPVLAYTVNDAARARTLFDWGVRAVFTDAPGRLAAELAGQD